jgi:hypothetical protein
MPTLVLCAPLPYSAGELRRHVPTRWHETVRIDPDSVEVAGIVFQLQFSGHDPQLADAFRACSEVDPEALGLDAIAMHASVAYLVGPDTGDNDEETLAVAQYAQTLALMLFDSGAIGVKCDSSEIAHPRDTWRDLQRRTRDGLAAGNAERFFSALVANYVRIGLKGPDGAFMTRGLHLVGRPEVACTGTLIYPAVDLLYAFAMYQLAVVAPGDIEIGELFATSPKSPPYTIRWGPDELAPNGDLAFDPWGRFWLDPVTESPG